MQYSYGHVLYCIVVTYMYMYVCIGLHEVVSLIVLLWYHPNLVCKYILL